MSANPNRVTHFWQELKRRKVLKVLVMYAGAAYVLIELTSNVAAPLNLPEWTPRLVILFLVIGFPITAVLSWIFDITPSGIVKTESAEVLMEEVQPQVKTRRELKISDGIIAALLVAVCILIYPKIFNTDQFEDVRDENGRISIAVMPFENFTGDSTLSWFQRGISSLIINGLGSSLELSVRDDHTMFEVIESMDQVFTAGLTPSLAKEVADKVRAGIYITGNCQGRLNQHKIFSNIIDTESGEIIWTGSVEGNLNSPDYLDMANLLCNQIKDFLEIKALKQDVDYDFREAYTESSEAYRYFIEGMNSIFSLNYGSAVESFHKALEIDSTFTFAKFFIAWAYINDPQWQWEYVEPWILKAYQGKGKLPFRYQLWMEVYYANYISKSLPDIVKYCELLEESGIQSRLLWFDLGCSYLFLGHLEKAVGAFGKIEQINTQRNDIWKYRPYFTAYGEALHKTGKHEKEAQIYEIGIEVCPEIRGANDLLLHNQAVCALSLGDTLLAKKRLLHIKNRITDLGYPEHVIDYFIGYIYENAGMPDEAEEHFYNLYKLAPKGDRIATYTWGRFLILNDLDIEKGIELVDQVLVMVTPDSKLHFVYTYMKSFGLFKQNKYNEAKQLLKIAEEGWVGYYPDLYELQQDIDLALATQNQ